MYLTTPPFIDSYHKSALKKDTNKNTCIIGKQSSSNEYVTHDLLNGNDNLVIIQDNATFYYDYRNDVKANIFFVSLTIADNAHNKGILQEFLASSIMGNERNILFVQLDENNPDYDIQYVNDIYEAFSIGLKGDMVTIKPITIYLCDFSTTVRIPNLDIMLQDLIETDVTTFIISESFGKMRYVYDDELLINIIKCFTFFMYLGGGIFDFTSFLDIKHKEINEETEVLTYYIPKKKTKICLKRRQNNTMTELKI